MNNIADIENCFNSSPYFGNILSEKRSEKIVLPKVFQILSKFYADENNKDESYREQTAGSHPMTGFWKCRLVSKSWNKAIEEVHQRMERENDTCALTASGHLIKWTVRSFQPAPERSPIRFLTHFSNTHYDNLNDKLKKNPFLGRMVFMYLPLFDTDHEIITGYVRGANEMLRKYGGEIWGCRLVFYSTQHLLHPVNLYRRMAEFIKLMPNLNVLFLKCINDTDPYLTIFRIHIPIDEAEMEIDLGREIAEIEFPFLPNLFFVTSNNLSTVVTDQIRLRNPNAVFMQD